MKNYNLKLLFAGFVLLLFVSVFQIYSSIKQNYEIKEMILNEQTQYITSFFKSFRKTYQAIFVNNHTKLTKDSIKFLPVKTSNDISKYLSESLNSKIVLRTVSDRPRNYINMANDIEMKIIQKYKNTKSTDSILVKEKAHIYKYYEPLYITKVCLTCHGKYEDAPKIIQESYEKAYNYKLNDLRGIISLELDKTTLMNLIEKENKENILYILATSISFIFIIVLLYYRLQVNNVKSRKQLESKNKFLQVKAKEFVDLQNAIAESEIYSKTDADGIITEVNDKLCEISGYSREELIGRNHNIIRHPDVEDEIYKKMWQTITNKKVYKAILKNKKKDGTSYHVDSTIVPIINEDGEIKEYIAMRHYIEDIIDDSKLLDAMISEMKKSLLILVKLDRFEELEEFYTKDIITKIEEVFLKRSLSFCPNKNLFSKTYMLKNGEFAFIKEITQDNEDFLSEIAFFVSEFKDNIKRAKFTIDSYEYNPEVIVSIASGEGNIYEDAKQGLKYLIKENKTFVNANGFLEKSRVVAQKNIDTINMIKTALITGNVVSYFQAIYNNKTDKIDKYESLVRIINENGEVVSPFMFLETSKTGSYYEHITKVIIDNVFKKLEEIEEDISINLSFLDIENYETLEYLYIKMDESNHCDRLIVELLEDERVKNIQEIDIFIRIIKHNGVKVAIDDFGEGYSNFSRLLDFNPDIIKIDASLIKDIDRNIHSRNVVETIAEFAKKEGMKTVAEFVHSKEILDIVKEIGIDYSQGFYLGKPRAI